MKRNGTSSDPLSRAMKYCAYQERCHAEVLTKLKEWGVWGIEADRIILSLIEGNFLNEERFACAFAGGKFRMKKWGRLRIKRELSQRDISDYCIKLALGTIEEETYQKTLNKLINEKWNVTKERNPLIRKNKTATFLIGKGYEPSLVWGQLNKKGVDSEAI